MTQHTVAPYRCDEPAPLRVEHLNDSLVELLLSINNIPQSLERRQQIKSRRLQSLRQHPEPTVLVLHERHQFGLRKLPSSFNTLTVVMNAFAVVWPNEPVLQSPPEIVLLDNTRIGVARPNVPASAAG